MGKKLVPLLQFLCFFFLFFGVPISAIYQIGPPLEAGRVPHHRTLGTADIYDLELGLSIQHRTGGTAAFCDLESGTRDETFSETKEENAQNVFPNSDETYPFSIAHLLKKKKKKADRKEKKKIDGKKNISVPTNLSGSSCGEEGVNVASSNTRQVVTKERKNGKLKVNEIANSDCLRCIPSTPELKSATEYYEKGICFKEKRLRIKESILDISFSRGILYIPKLSINDETFDRLRNYIASEQTKPNQKVTAYLQFWASLAREPEDVTLLSKEGVISINHKRANEVVDMIQKLYKELAQHTSGESYLKPTYQQLDKYCRSMFWKWFVQSIRQFNPFFILCPMISTSVALLAVIYAVLRYYNYPHNGRP